MYYQFNIYILSVFIVLLAWIYCKLLIDCVFPLTFYQLSRRPFLTLKPYCCEVWKHYHLARHERHVSFALCVQLAWAKRSGWLEAVISGPGRPVTGVGRTRGRLPANWAQRMALQQAQAPADSVKIPKKRGPKPGSKVALFLKTGVSI